LEGGVYKKLKFGKFISQPALSLSHGSIGSMNSADRRYVWTRSRDRSSETQIINQLV